MGLIKAALGAAGGVMADQWKEYIYCESMPADVLVTLFCSIPISVAMYSRNTIAPRLTDS